MKKFLILLSLVLAMFVLASCQLPGNGDTPPGDDPNKENPPAAECDHIDPSIEGDNQSALYDVAGTAKKVSCTDDGATAQQKCYICEAVVVESEVIPATGHTPILIDPHAPTCAEAGNTAGYKCQTCNYVIKPVETIAKLEHHFVKSDSYPATCTSAGSEGGSHCSKCLATNPDDQPTVIPAFGHDRGLPHIIVTDGSPADCKTEGLSDNLYCTICEQNVLKAAVIPMTAHPADQLEVIPGTPATCQAKGISDGEKCKFCGVITIEQVELEIDPTVHPTDKLTVLPAVEVTCHSDGLTEGSFCEACQQTAVEQIAITERPAHVMIESIPALAPDCSTETNGHTVHMVCDNEGCDYEEPAEVIKYEHILGEWTTTTEPGVGTEGEKYTHCQECDKLITETIPALPGENDNGDLPDYFDPDGIV